MIQEYIRAALSKAHYEIIKDEEPYYGKLWKNAGLNWQRLLRAG